MTPLHPILDPTKRIRLIYDPNGEARYLRQREGRWIGLVLMGVVFAMLAIVHLRMWFP